ncbi:MAG TPA: hypothetical protein VIK35_05500 [Verrucomicrobiae bacterium]
MLPATKTTLKAVLMTDQTVAKKERSKIIGRIFRANDGDKVLQVRLSRKRRRAEKIAPSCPL